MSLINKILKINGAKYYDVYRSTKTKNATTGGTSKAYSLFTNVFACIQPPKGRANGMVGLEATTDAGDVPEADYVMYSAKERFENERVLYLGLYYDIKNAKFYDNGYLKFFRCYLVKVDNQIND